MTVCLFYQFLIKNLFKLNIKLIYIFLFSIDHGFDSNDDIRIYWCLEFASPWKWPEFASSYQQLHSQPRLPVLEDSRTADTWANGWTTYKSKEVGWNWHRFKASQRGSDVFVSINSQKNLESEFLYWKVLFIPEIRRDNGILCFLVITRGIPELVGSGDTWWFNSPLI